MSEEWREIPGLEGHYEASSLGRIRSLKRTVVRKNGAKMTVQGGVMTPNRGNRYGHVYVNIRVGNKRWYKSVHGLVAKTFLGPRPHGMEILHGGEGHLVNAVTNLRYGTKSENQKGTRRPGAGRQRMARR